MSDVVNDRLFAWPSGVSSWQDDADTTDTNKPQDSDSMLATSPTALAGELRRIKSETRGFSVDSAWQNYLGLESAPDINPPVRIDINTFTLAGDWTAIAQVGRQVRATFTDLTKEIATIGSLTFSGGVTTVTLNMGILSALKTLAYVEFSALGSAATSLLEDSTGPLLPAYPLSLNRVGTGTAAKFVVPAAQGGTGTVLNVFGGDLDGNYPPMDATVAKLQGITLDSTPLAGAPLDQFLHYDVGLAKWVSATIASVINGGFSGDDVTGTVLIENPVQALKLKWIVASTQTISPSGELDGTLGPFAWDTGNPFTANPFLIWAFGASNSSLLLRPVLGGATDTQITIAYRNFNWITQGTPATVPDTTSNSPFTETGRTIFIMALGF